MTKKTMIYLAVAAAVLGVAFYFWRKRNPAVNLPLIGANPTSMALAFSPLPALPPLSGPAVSPIKTGVQNAFGNAAGAACGIVGAGGLCSSLGSSIGGKAYDLGSSVVGGAKSLWDKIF